MTNISTTACCDACLSELDFCLECGEHAEITSPDSTELSTTDEGGLE